MIDNNFTFDYIFICSSGGSQSGLELAKLYYEWDKTEIIGINHIPWKNEENLKKHFSNIWTEMNKILDTNISMPDINNITKYALPSYGKSNNKTMKLIKDIAINKKILFDPYYSGKAFGGMMEHLKNKKNKKVLFIHTGGGENLLNYSREITPINFKTLLNYLLYKSKRTSLKKLSKIKRFILNE
jgi:D-cysteine desulfhydrase